MKVHYINLDRSTGRRETFLDTNRGIAEFERFSAVDGQAVDPQALVDQGIVAEALEVFPPRAIGSALSHKALWEQCIEEDAPLTIAEDDAVFRRDFADRAGEILQRLPADWEMLRWGWNTDGVLDLELVPGLKDAVLSFEPGGLGPRLPEFRELACELQTYRLNQGFGLVCYTVSPAGARRLHQLCFPLRNALVKVRGLSRPVLATSVDTLMNRERMKAWVCIPPLVWSENIKGDT